MQWIQIFSYFQRTKLFSYTGSYKSPFSLCKKSIMAKVENMTKERQLLEITLLHFTYHKLFHKLHPAHLPPSSSGLYLSPRRTGYTTSHLQLFNNSENMFYKGMTDWSLWLAGVICGWYGATWANMTYDMNFTL